MTDQSEQPQKGERKTVKSKDEALREAQRAKAQARIASERKGVNANPIVGDAVYGDLRDDNRVVMRHQIALNIDTFRAAPEDFVARPARSYPPLKEVTAPFLSVIIPNYNGETLLPTVLGALAEQRFRDFEIIVVDDASMDGSVAWLEEHAPQVRLVVNRTNQGFVKSCNSGADIARGKVLVFLNSDTEPDAGWTEALARAVCAMPNVGILASKLLLFDRRDTLHSAGDGMGADGIPRNRGVWEVDQGQYDGQVDVFGGCGGAVAYRRELWQALGGFDESFWMYLEDADLAFRAQLLGWDAAFVPEARVYHHLSATGGGVLASYYVGRNTIWMIAKNMPRSILLRRLPQVIGAQVRIALDALAAWRGDAARARLRGQLAGLVGLRTALQKRQVIQPRRVREDQELSGRLGQ